MNTGQLIHKFLASMLILAFLVSDVRVYAQGVIQLPVPGTRLALSPLFAPSLLKGIKVYRNDPFRFDFILDKGDATATDEQVKIDSTRLIKYFLASLTVPEKDLWVNLSPYEKDRIVPEAFGQTEMGRDLLAQDYILKQITASVIYPEGRVGKEFWDKVYVEALKRYGTTDVPVDTFNKVWIIPEKAMVCENKDAAFVVESKLKVMLEEDYLAFEKNIDVKPQTTQATNKIGSEIIREVVIPILEKEVNEGKNFAPLRQVYHSLILATWYKRKIKDGIMGQAYVDKQKTGGIDIADKNEKEKIWAQYVEAFRRGAYNFIKEEYDPSTRNVISRKYFSGGASLAVNVQTTVDYSMINSGNGLQQLRLLFVRLIDASSVQDVVPVKESKQAYNIGDNGFYTRENATTNNAKASAVGRKFDTKNLDPQVYEKIFQEWERSLMSFNLDWPVFVIGGHPGSGKSSLARLFEKYLQEKGQNTIVIHTDKLSNNAVAKFVKAVSNPRQMLSLARFPKDVTKHEKLKRYINRVMINKKRVRNFDLQMRLLQKEAHKTPVQLSVPGRSEPIMVKPGTIFIIEGVFVKDMLPELSATSSVYISIPQTLAEERIIQRGLDRGWSYARSKFEERLANLSVARDLYDPQKKLYEYELVVLANRIVMNKLTFGKDDESVNLHQGLAIHSQTPQIVKDDVQLTINKGGIDFNPSRIDMATRSSSEGVKCNLDFAMLQRMQDASGVTPVIIGIHSLDSLSAFMGVQASGVK